MNDSISPETYLIPQIPFVSIIQVIYSLSELPRSLVHLRSMLSSGQYHPTMDAVINTWNHTARLSYPIALQAIESIGSRPFLSQMNSGITLPPPPRESEYKNLPFASVNHLRHVWKRNIARWALVVYGNWVSSEIAIDKGCYFYALQYDPVDQYVSDYPLFSRSLMKVLCL